MKWHLTFFWRGLTSTYDGADATWTLLVSLLIFLYVLHTISATSTLLSQNSLDSVIKILLKIVISFYNAHATLSQTKIIKTTQIVSLWHFTAMLQIKHPYISIFSQWSTNFLHIKCLSFLSFKFMYNENAFLLSSLFG